MSFKLKSTVSLILCGLLTIAALSFFTNTQAIKADQPRRIKVLFLGDRGHHRPADRAKQLIPVLAKRGIDVFYTEDHNQLTPSNLNLFDALLVYANISSIKPEHEKSILDFVASGKGFVPIHCASYCFHNSPKLIALTGAQFKSHGTGVMTTTTVKPDHPAIKGLKDITSWDETYRHHKHNEKRRTVLQVHKEKNHTEPWTWVRTHGKGRVFYTAWGHDQRTWSKPGFHRLVERGIRWASGDWALKLAPPKLKPFEYKPARFPNYIPGKRWGAQGDPNGQMQLPLPAEESIKHMILPPGFKIQLFAAEPFIGKPICMAWDHRGRLWIAETVDYPNDIKKEGEGRDRIRILEDTNNDGRADKSIIFAKKLSIPTSLTFANGGVIVHQAPHTLFLKDSNGDDKADVRKKLFSGWSTGDTHAGPSNLRYGLDNHIWGMQGYAGFNGKVGDKSHRFRQGFYRFTPDASSLEFVRSTNNNTWGLGFSEEGIIFGSTANNNPSTYMPIPNRYYESVRGWSPSNIGTIADTAKFNPITDKVRQVDVHGGYTAAAGHALYTARLFPRFYWNRTAFVNGPTGHLTGVFTLHKQGSHFKSTNPFNIVASDDEWTAPIMAEVGPDGALWFIDWYNFIIQHNPTPRGFKNGRGNAYVTDLRDKKHGRIYRILPTNAKLPKPITLHKATPTKLVQTLTNDNMLWRLHAQRLLVEQKQTKVIPQLIQLINNPAVDAIGLNTAAIHALWTLHGLTALDGSNSSANNAAFSALTHPSAGVRRNAVQVLPPTQDAISAILAAKLLDDPDPQVRLMTLLALADLPPSDTAGAAVYAMIKRPANASDRWIPEAAIAAAAKHDAGFLKATLGATENKTDPKNINAPKKKEYKNLIPNPSFEKHTDKKPASWSVRTYAGQAQHALVEGGRTGKYAVQITSKSGTDTSWFVSVPVKPNTNYRLSAWIKTRGVRNVAGGFGALLNVHELQGPVNVRTQPLKATNDWKKVSITFNSRGRRLISINCLFGGWGRAAGTAWYDDLELIQLDPGQTQTGLSGALGKVVRAVTTHYAQRGPTDSVVATLSALRGADPQLSAAILDGLTSGWPRDASPRLSPNERAQLSVLIKSLPDSLKNRLISLAKKWNRGDVFSAQLGTVIAQLKSTLTNTSLTAKQRIAAAQGLISIKDTPAHVSLIVKQISPTSPPALSAGLLNALTQSRQKSTGATIIAHFPTMTPAAQSAATNVLTRRAPWTLALLHAIQAKKLNIGVLTQQQLHQLSLHNNKEVASLAKAVGKARLSNPDMEKLIKQYLPVVQKAGNAKRGEIVYNKFCSVCHEFNGKGGKVGPTLTGIAAKPREDILIDIVDPNRSVEGTYRQFIVTKKDGQALFGRLALETKTSIQILDALGKQHIIQRDQIKSLTAAPVSIMPPGLVLGMKKQELTDLFQYLTATPHHK